MRLRSLLPLFLLATAASASAWTIVPDDLVWAHSMQTRQGVSSWFRFTIRVSNPQASVQWKIQHASGFVTSFSPPSGMGSVTPHPSGWADVSVPFSPPPGAGPGETSGFVIKLCVDGEEVASDTGCISISGSGAGTHYSAVDPQPSHVFTGNRGRTERISFVVPNDESDLLPHTYDFLLIAENDLAPGLDLYDLTPVSGFDLPTVIGAGTPLMSGKLEEILPGDELLLELDVTPPAGQTRGSGNEFVLELFDDDSAATIVTSSNVVTRCQGMPAAFPRNPASVNPLLLVAHGTPVAGRDWRVSIETPGHEAGVWTALLVGARPTDRPTAVGTLLVEPDADLVWASFSRSDGGRAEHIVALPTAAEGGVHLQGLVLGARSELSNALDLSVVPVEGPPCTFDARRPAATNAGS